MFVIDAVGRADEDVVIQFARAGKEAEIAAQSIKHDDRIPNITVMGPMGTIKFPSVKEQDRAKWQFAMRLTVEEYEALGFPGVGTLFNLGFVLMPREPT